MDISTKCRQYPWNVDISAILRNIHIRRYYLHFVNTIGVGHIMIYLARNVCHVLHSFVLFVDTILGHITSYLACNFHFIPHIYPSSESECCSTSFPMFNLICFSVPSTFRPIIFESDYKLNLNPICIYAPPFITSIKASLIPA